MVGSRVTVGAFGLSRPIPNHHICFGVGVKLKSIDGHVFETFESDCTSFNTSCLANIAPKFASKGDEDRRGRMVQLSMFGEVVGRKPIVRNYGKSKLELNLGLIKSKLAYWVDEAWIFLWPGDLQFEQHCHGQTCPLDHQQGNLGKIDINVGNQTIKGHIL